MSAVRSEFTPEQVGASAMNWRQEMRIVGKFIADTGLKVPVLLDRDKGSDPLCFAPPPGPEGTVTEHFRNRIVSEGMAAPFPLQIIVDGEGRLAYLSRVHAPDKVIAVLRRLVDG